MSKHITRRKAITVGAASAGMLIRKANGASVRESPALESHPPFLTPWSPPSDLKRDLTPGNTPIRLAAWSKDTTLGYWNNPKISISDMVKRIRDKGYTSACAHIKRCIWHDAPEEQIRELKEALNKYDVTFFDMHSTGSNIHHDSEERRKVNRSTIEACEAAERIGCPMVTTHIGSAGDEYPMSPHKNNWTMETWRLGVKVMKGILKDTSGMNVALGMEAVNMTIMNNPRAHLQLIQEIADPRIKVCLDPVNMIYLGTYFRNTELIEECFDLLSEHIIAAHAKDTYILPNKMSAYITEVAPGRGVLDYETYLTGLSRLNNSCSLLIEHIPQEQYTEAKRFIENTAARIGVKIYS